MTDADWGQFLKGGSSEADAASGVGDAAGAAVGGTGQPGDESSPSAGDFTAQPEDAPTASTGDAVTMGHQGTQGDSTGQPQPPDASAASTGDEVTMGTQGVADAAASTSATGDAVTMGHPGTPADSTAQPQPAEATDAVGTVPEPATAGAVVTDSAPGGQTAQPADAGNVVPVPGGGGDPGAAPTQPSDQPPGQGGTWEDWAQSSLAASAVMEEVAAEHLQAASDWAAYGNMEAAHEELAEAQIAAELGAQSAMMAQTEFEMSAASREGGAQATNEPGPLATGPNDTPNVDSGQYDAGQVDTGQYDEAPAEHDQGSSY